jgi:hypothetical protein
LSAVVPTLLATKFFEPRPVAADAFEDFDAAEEIDAGPIGQPQQAGGPNPGSA